MIRMQLHTVDLARSFWRDRWFVIAIVVSACVLSTCYALTRKPVFTSEALLAASEDGESGLGALSGVLGQVSALSGVLGMPRIGGTSLEEIAAIMRSKDFSLRFIRKHDLLPVLFPERNWLVSTSHSPGLANPVSPAGGLAADASNAANRNTGNSLRAEDVLDRFDTVRNIVIDRRTNFVSLSVKARDPLIAQRICQDLIDGINSELRARALVEARQAEQFLQSKISATQYESIKNTAAALLESQLKREVLAESRADFALRILDPPSLPETRSYPHRSKLVIIGGLLGVLCAVVLVLFRRRHELIRRSRDARSSPGGPIENFS